MKPYPRFMRHRAEVLKLQGRSYASIAAELKVSRNTARRWLDPEYRMLHNKDGRDRKRNKYTGQCVDCGAPTSYSGKGTKASKRCVSCAGRLQKVWVREEIIKAVRRWADRYGSPPTSYDWMRSTPGEYPAATACYGRNAPFRCWADVIEAAGFPRPTVGHNQYKPLRTNHRRKRTRDQRIADLHKALERQ